MTEQEIDSLKPGDIIGSGLPGMDMDLYLQFVELAIDNTGYNRYTFVILLDMSDPRYRLAIGRTLTVGKPALMGANVEVLRD